MQLDNVQRELFGRILDGKNDHLPRYQVKGLQIKDQLVIEKSGRGIHPILTFTGDSKDIVSGMVFEISKEELK